MLKKEFFRVLGLAGLLCLLTPAFAQQSRSSPTLDNIRQDKVIKVGVKTDFKPFNSLDSSGNVVGFESEVAALIAKRLGVQLQKVKITTENRFQKLALGDVDILIATVGDTAERRKSATAVEPGYNETSVNIMFKPGQAVDAWSKIRNRTVCAVQGGYFNRPITERYLLKLQTYKTVRDAHLGLRDNQCSGFLYATAALQNTQRLPEWSGYTMPLTNALITPMAIFIVDSEHATELDIALGDILADLHRSGWLLAESKKWGIASTEWLTMQQAIWSEKDASGKFVCVRGASGLWDAHCRSGQYVASSEVSGLQALGLRIKENTGLDLNVVYDPYDRAHFLRGVVYTMLLIATGISISLVLGAAVSAAVDGRSGLGPRVIHTVMAYGRLTPPLIMMYLIFFGIGGWTSQQFGVKLPAFAVATFCSGYYTAGLIMRALLEAASHIRSFDAAFVLRLNNLRRTAQFASLPVKQALINLTKQTMLASAIAIPELLSASSLLVAEKGNIFLTMTILLISFYLTTSLWTRIINRLETAILAPLATPCTSLSKNP